MDDLISRQDAIETIRKLPNAGIHWLVSAEAVFDALLKLPPAQPEPRWTPVTEELPKKNRKPKKNKKHKTFLVTDSNGKLSISEFILPLSNSDQPYWSGMINVIAWMPLPKPYKEKET